MDSDSFLTGMLIAYLVYLIIRLFIWPSCEERVMRFMAQHGMTKIDSTKTVSHSLVVLEDPTPPTQTTDSVMLPVENVQEAKKLDIVNEDEEQAVMVPSSTQVGAAELKTMSQRAAETSMERDAHIIKRFNPAVPVSSLKNPWHDEIAANVQSKPDEYIKMS
tara:strand:- start:7561 stop:8046 length:486 start_codon:yes stop_codon:yes gene_type:complete